MRASWIEDYIKALDLNEIRNPNLRKETESIIRRYLENADRSDSFRKIAPIQDLIKWLKEDIVDFSSLEAIEHVKNKLEEKFGLPTLPRLFEFSPERAEYRVPPVFYEHPEMKKIRILKTIELQGRDKITDTEVLDANQLKIHYAVGNLDWKIVDKEETTAKVCCGRVRYDWDKGCRYILINDKSIGYPHDFDIKDVSGTFHLSPNSVSMRVVPRRILPREGVLFCPSCYNLYDNDEISEQHFQETQAKIRAKIRELNISEIDERWNICPYCSWKSLSSNDQKEIKQNLLFSYMYCSNLYPDIIPLSERCAHIDETHAKKIINHDRVLRSLLGSAIYTKSARVSELLEGFTRSIGIHRSEKDQPTRPIYLWQQRNLRKGDKNIYYYYQTKGKNIPARISLEIKKTDAICFDTPHSCDLPIESMKTSLILDLAFSCIRILLGEKFPAANIFALDLACEAAFSYYLLSREMKIPEAPGEVYEDIFKRIKDLHLELRKISDSCVKQNIEFRPASLPNIKELISQLPMDLSFLHEKITFENGEETLEISRRLALVIRLFSIGEKQGNLHISSNKKHAGLDFDTAMSRALSQNIEGFQTSIERLTADIYVHTLSHQLYRSAIEVSKCDENDISYDYNPSGKVMIYDNYSGGAGFVEECIECFDNLRYEIRIRPKFGLLQQFEGNSGLCMNYLVNFLLYEGISPIKLKDLRNLIEVDPASIVKQIQSIFSLVGAANERVLLKAYGRNLLSLLHSLTKRRIPLLYALIRESFGLRYDDLILVQRCPTIFLLVLLCQLDDHRLSVLLREVFRENVSISEDRQDFTLLMRMWERIFTSNLGILFSNFNRSYTSKFEDMLSTCIRGCSDCTYLSFGCKYPILEQDFRINTQLTRLTFSRLREKYSLKFPDTKSALLQSLKKAEEEETLYFHFLLEDFQKINGLFNTFLSKFLTYDFEQCQPLFSFDFDGDKLKAFIKLRKRVQE